MSRKIIDKNVLEQIKKCRVIGSGLEGICYHIEGTNDLVKIYYDEKIPEIINFEDRKSDYIAFPKDVLVDCESNKIIGITMPYLPGSQFTEGFPEDIEITKLEEAYNVLYQEIQKFSDVDMKDLCLENILYDRISNRFYLIDTGRWDILPDIATYNMSRFERNLSSSLCMGNLAWLKDYEKLSENTELHYSYYTVRNNGYCQFWYLLNLVKKIIEEDFGQEVVYIGDLKPKMFKKS